MLPSHPLLTSHYRVMLDNAVVTCCEALIVLALLLRADDILQLAWYLREEPTGSFWNKNMTLQFELYEFAYFLACLAIERQAGSPAATQHSTDLCTAALRLAVFVDAWWLSDCIPFQTHTLL